MSSDYFNYQQNLQHMHLHSQLPFPSSVFVKKIWRKGKWTEEEEAYAENIVAAFNAGLLDIPPGTTLRSALSELLNCDPMRITKKYSGSCIGKQPYQPIRHSELNTPAAIALKEDLEKTKEEFHALVERNQELQNSNSLFTTQAPYSQILQEYLPVAADSGDNYHAILHQHALASLHVPPDPLYPAPEIQATSYPHGNAGYFTDPHISSPQNSCPSLPPDPSSRWQSSYSSYHDLLSQQQQPTPSAHHSQQSPPPTTPIDRDREWGIPSFYNPRLSPRLPILYSSSTPSTPHTTNQPYIYLPPRFSTPPVLPRYTAALSSDDMLKPLSDHRSIHANTSITPQSHPSYSHLNASTHLISQNISHHVSAPLGENLFASVSSLSEAHHPIEQSDRDSMTSSLSHEKKRKK